MSRWHDEHGSADVAAMMFIIPMIMGVVLLFVYIGRQSDSNQGVTHAAQVAARAASLQRDASSAIDAAHAAAASTLSAAGTACAGGPAVQVSTDQWAPGGVITVTVACTVEVGDLGAIGVSAHTFTGTSRSVIDEHRAYEE